MLKVNVLITHSARESMQTNDAAMTLTNFRLSASIFALFLVIGIYLPFLPAWLEGRGMSAQQIGVIFAVALWARIPIGLMLASIIDATGQR